MPEIKDQVLIRKALVVSAEEIPTIQDAYRKGALVYKAADGQVHTREVSAKPPEDASAFVKVVHWLSKGVQKFGLWCVSRLNNSLSKPLKERDITFIDEKEFEKLASGANKMGETANTTRALGTGVLSPSTPQMQKESTTSASPVTTTVKAPELTNLEKNKASWCKKIASWYKKIGINKEKFPEVLSYEFLKALDSRSDDKKDPKTSFEALFKLEPGEFKKRIETVFENLCYILKNNQSNHPDGVLGPINKGILRVWLLGPSLQKQEDFYRQTEAQYRVSEQEFFRRCNSQ